MNRGLQITLVLLRLAIGWHLLIEGLAKLESVAEGNTTRNRAWTSRPYLLEAQGPLAGWFKELAGDPDQQVLDLVKLPPADQPTPTSRLVMPFKVKTAWEQYMDRLFVYYRLDKRRKNPFAEVMSQTFERHKRAFCDDKIKFTARFPWGSVAMIKTLPERIAEYEAKYNEYQAILNKELPAFGRDVRQRGLAEVKAELNQLRNEVLKQVMDRSEALHHELETLYHVLLHRQSAAELALWALVPDAGLAPSLFWVNFARYQSPSYEFLKPFLKDDPIKEYRDIPQPGPMMPMIDFTMRWGLTLAGAGLLLGLFTRLWCAVGAILLLLIYLAMPPLPWLPEQPRSAGHAILVNQTLIEVLALFMLMWTPSGRWLGLDAVWSLLLRRKPAPSEANHNNNETEKSGPNQGTTPTPAPRHRRR